MNQAEQHDLIAIPERELPLWRSLDVASQGTASITVGSETLRWSQLRSRALRLACGLEETGVGPGTRVASISTDRIECVEIAFAAAALGAIWVPLGPYLTGHFLAGQLRACEPEIVLADEAGALACAPFVDGQSGSPRLVRLDTGGAEDGLESIRSDGEVDPVDDGRTTAAILFTSGTTGAAKGCMVSHGYFVKSAACYGRSLEVCDSDVVYSAFPLFHGAGLATAVMALVSQATYVNPGAFHASRFMADAKAAAATVVIGTGAMATTILAQPTCATERQHDIRVAEFVPLGRLGQERFSARFGVRMYGEHYGQTECMMATQTPLAVASNPGSVGRESELVQVCVVDDDDQVVEAGTVGEIVLRPKTSGAMFSGYWRDPEATLRACRGLWHHTGDYGVRDTQGVLNFVDRKSDSLRRRGENVSSLEVEAALIEHAGIAEVAVHAVPSALTEDDIKVCIVPADGTSVRPEDLFEFFARVLPYFAMPRYVELLHELPKTANNKVRKDLLRESGNGPDTWDFEQLGFVVDRAARRSVR